MVGYLSSGIETPASRELRSCPSAFAMEYGVALLENLCFNPTSQSTLLRFKDQFLQLMAGLLGHNPLLLPYLIRTLYPTLGAVVRIRQAAKERGDFETLLTQKMQKSSPELRIQCGLVLAVLRGGLPFCDIISNGREGHTSPFDNGGGVIVPPFK